MFLNMVIPLNAVPVLVIQLVQHLGAKVQNPLSSLEHFSTPNVLCKLLFHNSLCSFLFSTADLTVTVSKIASSNIIVEGENLTLQCTINLALNELTPPVITWIYPNGNDTEETDSGTGEYELTIVGVTAKEDKGQYYCYATVSLQTGEIRTVTDEIYIDVIGRCNSNTMKAFYIALVSFFFNHAVFFHFNGNILQGSIQSLFFLKQNFLSR